MTYYESIKMKLQSGEYIIYREQYASPVKCAVYSIRTPKVDGMYSTFCDIAFNIAIRLSKELGIKITRSDKESIALNYTPSQVSKDCVRTFHEDPQPSDNY